MARHRLRYSLWERITWALLLLGGTCHCTGSSQTPLPRQYRPDTQSIMWWHIDTVTLRRTHQLLLAAFPKEASFCWLGSLTQRDDSTWRVDIDDVAPAQNVDSADEAHVWFHDPEGCPMPRALGIGHDHPYAIMRACEHGRDDVTRLFMSKLALFSVVMCGSGHAELLWQDGRRRDFEWGHLPDAVRDSLVRDSIANSLRRQP